MSSRTKLIRNSTAELLIFTGSTGEQRIEARYENVLDSYHFEKGRAQQDSMRRKRLTTLKNGLTLLE